MKLSMQSVSSGWKRGTAAIKRFFSKKPFQYSVVQIFLLSFLMTLVTDSFSRFSFIKAVVFLFTHPLIFLVNLLIIAIFLAPAVLFRHRAFFYFFGCILWLAVGVIDFVVLHNRVTPFNGHDFRMLDDAKNVLTKYYNWWQIAGLAFLILFGVSLLVIAFILLPKQKEPVQYRHAFPLCLSIIFGCILLCIGSRKVGIMAKSFPNVAQAYQEYGLPYCFIYSIIDNGIDKPDNYGPDSMQNLVDSLNATPSPFAGPSEGPGNDKQKDRTPNIIYIQLESFFDPNRIKGIEFPVDPIPNFTYLRKYYTSGLLSVPSISAGTSNTEFEVLTGMNMDDFGTGEYPYKTILLEKTCESIAYNLKDRGYAAHAIHDNIATFYSRHIVYSNLGFDDFDTIEMMENVERNELNWARDAVLYDEILAALDSTPGSDLVFTVSVQGHGKYPDEDILASSIELTPVRDAYDDSTVNGLKYYVTQLHEMDELIGRLIEHFTDYEEDVVLVLYGDHLPGFNFTENDLNEGRLLQTEYAIWANFEMPVEKIDLEAFQLSAYLMSRLGFNDGLVTKLHQRYMAMPEEERDSYLSDLTMLSYDMLYGSQYCWGGNSPLKQTTLRYGFHDIQLTSSHTIYSPTDGKYYLQLFGKHFTPYANIVINGTLYHNTVYVSGEEVFLPGLTLKEGDVISVAIPAENNMMLRESNPLVFGEGELRAPAP